MKFVPTPEYAKGAYEKLVEGFGGGDIRMQNDECRMQNGPHPNPPPEYQGRGQYAASTEHKGRGWDRFPPRVSLRRALADYLGRIAGVPVQIRDFSVDDMPGAFANEFSGRG